MATRSLVLSKHCAGCRFRPQLAVGEQACSLTALH
jgi:deoxyribodipyrimidine photolyase-like uncharacterized protein